MRTATLYEFALAILVLWLVLEYIPGGIWIGLSVLTVTMLSTPGAVDGVSKLLAFIQHPA